MVKSVPYHPFLIEQLKDPVYAAGYLALFLNEQEEGDLDVGIFPSALKEVFEALGEPNMSADDAKLHLTIYGLAHWLKALGLKLTVAVDAGDEEISANVAELAEVGKV
jgi:hypothetical protein